MQTPNVRLDSGLACFARAPGMTPVDYAADELGLGFFFAQ
jgi:hypothetical protein